MEILNKEVNISWWNWMNEWKYESRGNWMQKCNCVFMCVFWVCGFDDDEIYEMNIGKMGKERGGDRIR